MTQSMGDALAHRGPDDSGVWSEPAIGVALAHRRLSILDPSASGHQPMVSPSGRYVVTYNGEIYNFRALRSELERDGVSFRGGSDTEVLVAALDAWGIPATLTKVNGMFAVGIWDAKQRALSLARDRLGEKPLYYGWVGKQLIFASQLSALRVHPGVRLEVDRQALAQLLRYGYVPAPRSILQGISKLQPGRLLSVDVAAAHARRCELSSYWSLADAVSDGMRAARRLDEADAVQALHELLLDAVGLRLRADVPLGAFLSGGIDSSLVVALMQQQSAQPVRTFAVGFDDPAVDESEHAAAVAAHLGTDHTQLRVTGADALGLVDRLPQVFDEPFADPSQIPTLLISQLTRRHVTVALSGDGGDELFGGYNRYQWNRWIWRRVGWLPPAARRLLADVAQRVPASQYDRFGGKVGVVARQQAGDRIGDRALKVAQLLSAPDQDALYHGLISLWQVSPVLGAHDSVHPAFAAADALLSATDRLARMGLIDSLSYLPDDILTKVDRATMAVGLEARVPLLDHRVVELSWRIGSDCKVRDGVTKWPLREVLHRYVPRALVERPKRGFGVPLASWLRGPLKPWAQELLEPARIAAEGYFEPAPIARCWSEHLSGARDWQYRLWPVLMFQSWLAGSSSS